MCPIDAAQIIWNNPEKVFILPENLELNGVSPINLS
jgi:hypothetical protein